MSRSTMRPSARALLGGCSALALVVAAALSTAPVAHAQTVIAAAVTSEGAAGASLTMTPGATGIPAIDAACLGNEVVVTGAGAGSLDVEAAGVFTGPPGFILPVVPAGFGAEYVPGDFEVSGGECAGSSGPAVFTLSGFNEVNGGFFNCPGLSGSFVTSGALHEFTVSGTCTVNGLSAPMSFSSVGLLTDSLPPPAGGGDTDVAVIYSTQLETCC